jgi:hypothetical protein
MASSIAAAPAARVIHAFQAALAAASSARKRR